MIGQYLQADRADPVMPSSGASRRSSPLKSTKGTSDIREEEGDLFRAPRSSSLAHCVSSDLRMGAGIAVLFRNKFGRIDELKSQKKSVGEVAYLKEGSRFIFYLITKRCFFDKPTEFTLQDSLVEMRRLCKKFGVKRLAMPRIGCGLDGLKWPVVLQMLKDIFLHCDIQITIYSIPERKPTIPRFFSPSIAPIQNRLENYFGVSKPRSLPISAMVSKRKFSESYDEEFETPKKRMKMFSDDHHKLFRSSDSQRSLTGLKSSKKPSRVDDGSFSSDNDSDIMSQNSDPDLQKSRRSDSEADNLLSRRSLVGHSSFRRGEIPVRRKSKDFSRATKQIKREIPASPSSKHMKRKPRTVSEKRCDANHVLSNLSDTEEEAASKIEVECGEKWEDFWRPPHSPFVEDSRDVSGQSSRSSKMMSIGCVDESDEYRGCANKDGDLFRRHEKQVEKQLKSRRSEGKYQYSTEEPSDFDNSIEKGCRKSKYKHKRRNRDSSSDQGSSSESGDSRSLSKKRKSREERRKRRKKEKRASRSKSKDRKSRDLSRSSEKKRKKSSAHSEKMPKGSRSRERCSGEDEKVKSEHSLKMKVDSRIPFLSDEDNDETEIKPYHMEDDIVKEEPIDSTENYRFAETPDEVKGKHSGRGGLNECLKGRLGDRVSETYPSSKKVEASESCEESDDQTSVKRPSISIPTGSMYCDRASQKTSVKERLLLCKKN